MTTNPTLRELLDTALPCDCRYAFSDHARWCNSSNAGKAFEVLQPHWDALVADRERLRRAIAAHLEETLTDSCWGGSGTPLMEHDRRLWEAIGVEDPMVWRAAIDAAKGGEDGE